MGWMPSCRALSAVITTVAAAPSEVCDELPAVTVPLAWKAGFRLPSASLEVSARGPSSTLKTISIRLGFDPLGVVKLTGTGTISSSNLPPWIAAMAFLWLFSENSSACSRLMPKRLAQRPRREAHREIGIGVVVHQPGIDRHLVPAHGDHAHRFSAAADGNLSASHSHGIRSQRDGLKSGGAEAVDRHGGDLDRQAGAKRCDARNVHSLLGFRRGAADDHIFYLFGIELRNALQRAFDGHGGQIVWTRGAQSAFTRFSNGGAN